VRRVVVAGLACLARAAVAQPAAGVPAIDRGVAALFDETGFAVRSAEYWNPDQHELTYRRVYRAGSAIAYELLATGAGDSQATAEEAVLADVRARRDHIAAELADVRAPILDRIDPSLAALGDESAFDVTRTIAWEPDAGTARYVRTYALKAAKGGAMYELAQEVTAPSSAEAQQRLASAVATRATDLREVVSALARAAAHSEPPVVRGGPPPSASAHQLLGQGYRLAHRGELASAAVAYTAAAILAPSWPDAEYGRALVYDSSAMHGHPELIAPAVRAYRAFVALAPPSDPRVASAQKTIAALESVETGLARPEYVTVRDHGKWPYGRTAFSANVFLGMYLLFSDSSDDFKKLGVDTKRLGQGYMSFDLQALVRVQPRWMIGGTFGALTNNFTNDSKSTGWPISGSHLVGHVRYAFAAASDSTSLLEGYVQGGYGTHSESTINTPEVASSGSYYSGEIGFEMVSGNLLGFNLHTRLVYAPTDTVTKGGTAVPQRIDLSGWEILGFGMTFAY
jgi:hypothetical protein